MTGSHSAWQIDKESFQASSCARDMEEAGPSGPRLCRRTRRGTAKI